MIVTITGQKINGNLTLNKIQVLDGPNVENIIQLLKINPDHSVLLIEEIKGSPYWIAEKFADMEV